MNFLKTDDQDLIGPWRKQFYSTLTTELDSMWESLYIASAQTYRIESNQMNLGYCCIDADKSLLQIFLLPEFLHKMKAAIQDMVERGLILRAKMSSIEMVSMNACLALSNQIAVDTHCFQYSNHGLELPSNLIFNRAVVEDLEAVKSFYKDQVGFEDNFGYTENLIQRKELYIIREGGLFVGTGECRLSDSQTNVADLGMAVHRDHRGKGYGRQILQGLAIRALEVDRRPICSTTIDNIASQKAIEKAGFYCSHYIFAIEFTARN